MRFERRGFGGIGRRFGGSGRREFRYDDQPKPVKVGEEYDVEISETGSRGDGIARVNNFVVFVDGAKQGEKTRIKITDVRSRFALGQKTNGVSTETAETAEGEQPQETAEGEQPQETAEAVLSEEDESEPSGEEPDGDSDNEPSGNESEEETKD